MLGEQGAGLFRRVAFAARRLAKSAIKVGVDGLAIALKPALLSGFRCDEIERVGEQLSRLAEGAAVELALDALFQSGVEGQDHEASIVRDRVARKPYQYSIPSIKV